MEFAPIAYFQQHCANCHGDYGNAYGEAFGTGLSDAELRQVVDEMAYGPGFAPLEPAELDVQVAYHRALIKGDPFLTVRRDGNRLHGEVSPGSTVTIRTEQGEQPATVEGHTWQADVPAAVRIVAVAATQEDDKTEVRHVPAHSHTEPLKASAE